MKTLSMRAQDVVRSWFVVDAHNKVLGRLASGIAMRLKGKHTTAIHPPRRYRRFCGGY